MSSAFDPRIVRVGLQIGDDFQLFEGLDIRMSGQKFASPTMNQCTVKISNLTRDHRHFILTKATPMAIARTPILMTVDVGRESYGTFRLFEGEVYVSTVTPPPDIAITLVSLTNSFALGLIAANSQGPMTSIETIAKSIADANGLTLIFKATNRQIANFQHSGAIAKQVGKLAMIGDVRAWVDNKQLFVIDKDGYADDTQFNLSIDTGMVGVPQATQSGVIAQMLVHPGISVGQKVGIKSQINPAVNGDSYFLSSVHFDIANRDVPFWYTLTLTNQAAYSNGVTG